MAYDAREVLGSLERPRITLPPEYRPRWQRVLGLHRILGDVTYEGRILSTMEWLPFQKRFRDLGVHGKKGKVEADSLSEEQTEAVLEIFRDYLRAIGIPVEPILRLPPKALERAIEDFFTSQSRAAGRGEG